MPEPRITLNAEQQAHLWELLNAAEKVERLCRQTGWNHIDPLELHANRLRVKTWLLAKTVRI